MVVAGRLLLYLAATIGFAWLSRRLLGATLVSWRRALVAGLAGAGVGAFVTASLRRFGVEDDGSAVAAAFIAAVLVSMGLIVAFQLLARPRRSGPAPRSSPIDAVRSARRATEVAGIFARHGLGSYLGRSGGGDASPTGAQLRAALEESGVVFVKFGQMLAGRPDLVGDDVAAELALLRSDVTPLPRAEIEAELQRTLPGYEEHIATIDWEPLGSASIAQAYAATLRDGTDVVVKVRRPGVEDEVRRDAQVVVDLASRAERYSSAAADAGVADLARGFVRDLEGELDYRAEARAGTELATSYRASTVGVPAIHDELTTDSVIVMERAPGHPLSAGAPDAVSAERRHELAASLVETNLGAMLAGDRYHADPHPGNVMVSSDGELELIDFGATGVLTAQERAALSSLLLGLRLREPTMLRDALLGVAVSDGPVDVARLDRELARLLADHLAPGAELDPATVNELLRITTEEQLRLPSSSTTMFRSLVTLLDTLQRLDPALLALDAIAESVGDDGPMPTSPDELVDVAREETLKLIPLLRRAPRILDSVATQLDRGDLSVRTRLLADADDVRVITRLVNRVVLAFVAGVLGVVSAMLFGLDRGPYITELYSVYDLVGTIGLLCGAVLVMRVVLEAIQDDPPLR